VFLWKLLLEKKRKQETRNKKEEENWKTELNFATSKTELTAEEARKQNSLPRPARVRLVTSRREKRERKRYRRS
jgi:hypothetical protein